MDQLEALRAHPAHPETTRWLAGGEANAKAAPRAPKKRRRSFLVHLRPTILARKPLLSAIAVCWAHLPAGDEPALRIHRGYHRILARDSRPGASLRRHLGFLVWIPIAAFMAAYFTATFGPAVKRRAGKGFLRQGAEQLVLAVRAAIPPYYYYDFEFWDDRRRAKALCYLYRSEIKGNGIYALLRRRYTSPESSEALSSKAAFALRCQAHRVPVVPVLAVAQKGTLSPLAPGGEALPQIDLFVKLLRGSGGRGANAWIHLGNGRWRSNSGRELDRAGLAAHLQRLSQDKAYVVRPLVVNQRDLRDLSSGALSTVRVITCLDENGRPEATDALFKMSVRPEAIVDNYHAGGIVAKVDIATGTLGPATTGHRVWRDHPTTGARIEGRVLPMWSEILDLARRAHAIFEDQIAVGWDIAILDEGPRLVEGNKGPGVDSIQITLGGPLGPARFGELLAFHLERALDPAYDGRVAPTSGADR